MTVQPNSIGGDEAAIREMVGRWASAIRRRDRRGILSHHAHDMVMFDVPPPRQINGLAAYDQTWDLFYASAPDPAIFEIAEMHVEAGRDVAVAFALVRCSFTDAGGQLTPLDVRLTIAFRKRGDEWSVFHEHHSVPAAV